MAHHGNTMSVFHLLLTTFLSLAILTSIVHGEPTATTVNRDLDGPGRCSSSNTATCTIFTAKQYVWLNIPVIISVLGDGQYNFTSYEVGGTPYQDADLLCTFEVTDGVITGIPPNHQYDQQHNLLRLAKYSDTSCAKGQYVLTICRLATSTSPYLCWTTGYQVQSVDVIPPSIALTSSSSYVTPYSWSITQATDKAQANALPGAKASFTHTITATYKGGTPSNVNLQGTLKASNNHEAPIYMRTARVKAGALSCNLFTNSARTTPLPTTALLRLGTGESTMLYFGCTGTIVMPVTVTASVDWAEQIAVSTSDGWVPAPSACEKGTVTGTMTVGGQGVQAGTGKSHQCVSVTGVPPPSPGTLCVGESRFKGGTTYSWVTTKAYPAPVSACDAFRTTVTYMATDDPTFTGTTTKTVHVCGTVVGCKQAPYWMSTLAYRLITSTRATNGVCQLTPYVRQYAPFRPLNGKASCDAAAKYVAGIIKTGIASKATMAQQLTAQLLTMVLNVYYSETALGGNKINAPVKLGTIPVKIPYAVPALGTAAPLEIKALVSRIASKFTSKGWYGGDKKLQELARRALGDTSSGKVYVALV